MLQKVMGNTCNWYFNYEKYLEYNKKKYISR